jgi:mevalonate kinase
MFRQNIRDQLIRIDTVEPVVKAHPTYSIITAQSKKMAQDIGTLLEIMEAITFNSIEQREFLVQLVHTYMQSDKQKEETIKMLMAKAKEREEEMKKYKPSLEWLEDYFRKAGETTSA